MINWFVDKTDRIKRTVNAVFGELETLRNNSVSANYWLDNTHNIFAIVNDNGDDDKWIEIHLELYDVYDNMVGDITVIDTEDISSGELMKAIEDIVKEYYHE